ncbi:MAG: SurA N-terminal domain-containing protein [Desulfuromonadales bacterium]|nr:SurA N-terminal domain-containing protein [Desulfuromonadales bacterium]
MLDLIRKKQQTTLIKFVFWLIIATFVGTIFLVWGKGDDRGPESAAAAITVNGMEVSAAEYKNAYDNLYRFYQSIYGNSFNAEMEKLLKLSQSAYDQIVRQILLLQEGARLGISVSRQDVVDAIAQIPQFQVDGNFDRNTYLQILSYQRITPDAFEADQKRTLLTQKTESTLKDGVTVSAADIETEFVNQNETVDLSFVRVNPADFEKNVQIDDKALNSFYAENQEQFRTPPRIALRYLQFDPARYIDEVELEEEEINKYYRRNLDLYATEEAVVASHILIKVAPTDSATKKDEKRKLAEKILDQVNAGGDFAALARKYSDDPGSAGKGGDLGSFGRGTMVSEFEQTAFSMRPGEVSDLVETQFGLHIIKLSDYIKADIKPLDEVIDQVKAGLRIEKSAKFAFEKAMDAYNINRKSGDLEKAATEFNLGIKETGLFTREQSIDGIGTSAEVTKAAFALQEGELARPIAEKNAIYLITLKERQESRIPELSAIRSKVEEAYRQQEAHPLARQAAAQLLADLQAGKKLESLAKGVKAKVEQTGPFARTFGDSVPRIGESADLTKAAFELTTEAPVAPKLYEIGGRFIVVTLKQKIAADLAQLDEVKRNELRTSVQAAKQRELLDLRLETLKNEAEITLSPYILSLGVVK